MSSAITEQKTDYEVSDGHLTMTVMASSHNKAKTQAEAWLKSGTYNPELLPCDIRYTITDADGVISQESVHISDDEEAEN